jgi:hypothetical protein
VLRVGEQVKLLLKALDACLVKADLPGQLHVLLLQSIHQLKRPEYCHIGS